MLWIVDLSGQIPPVPGEKSALLSALDRGEVKVTLDHPRRPHHFLTDYNRWKSDTRSTVAAVAEGAPRRAIRGRGTALGRNPPHVMRHSAIARSWHTQNS